MITKKLRRPYTVRTESLSQSEHARLAEVVKSKKRSISVIVREAILFWLDHSLDDLNEPSTEVVSEDKVTHAACHLEIGNLVYENSQLKILVRTYIERIESLEKIDQTAKQWLAEANLYAEQKIQLEKENDELRRALVDCLLGLSKMGVLKEFIRL